MKTFFLACTLLGAAVLAVQVLLGFVGLDHDLPDLDADIDVGSSGLTEGLDLLSVRAIAAGVAFYGVAGLSALAAGWASALAAVAALVPGIIALGVTAFVSRQILRLESDGSLRLHKAVGAEGTVYLTVPGEQNGAGRVQFPLQGRTVELRAVTRESDPIATGTPIIVVEVVDGDTVEVVPTSTVGDILHDDG